MKKILLGLALIFSLSFGMGGMVSALDEPGGGTIQNPSDPTESAKNEACQGLTGQVGGSCSGGLGDISHILSVVLQVISFIAGIAAVIMVIVAGLKYITSGGDATKISSAKSTLIYAIVGIVVVALAQVLVHFVFTKATGK